MIFNSALKQFKYVRLSARVRAYKKGNYRYFVPLALFSRTFGEDLISLILIFLDEKMTCSNKCNLIVWSLRI